MAAKQDMDATEELVRLIAVLLRRTAETQAELIRDLHRAGFGNVRIGELIGTTPNTVNVTLQKAKKK